MSLYLSNGEIRVNNHSFFENKKAIAKVKQTKNAINNGSETKMFVS